MKYLLLLIFPTILIASQPEFNNYFNDQTMRIDYFHFGHANSDNVSIDKIYQYDKWAGNPNKLIDNFNNGAYYIKIYDYQSGQLIYSYGFDSYFKEYKTTRAGIEGKTKVYSETARIPFPKSKIYLSVEMRLRDLSLKEVFRTVIDPNDVSIIFMKKQKVNLLIDETHISGNCHDKLDILIVGEGYSKEETEKFKKDMQRFKDVLFKYQPYADYKDKINLRGIVEPMDESGVDEPRAGIFKNSSLSCTFNSLGSERYLLTEDNKSLQDIAYNLPFDALYIMVNSERYGGGGIYNFYCTFTADNQWFEYLFTHEFGHSFGGLADEYFTSSTAYEEFYPKGIEPVEPNITAHPEDLKWNEFISKGIEIPTPWNKKAFIDQGIVWGKKRMEMNDNIARLKKIAAPEKDIKEAEKEYVKLDRKNSEEVDALIRDNKYYGKVGAFEGAGYVAEGLYRPMIDCIMFSKGSKPFCKVCENAIIKRILHYVN